MGREHHYPGTYTSPHDSRTVYGIEEPEDLNTLPPIFVLGPLSDADEHEVEYHDGPDEV